MSVNWNRNKYTEPFVMNTRRNRFRKPYAGLINS